jgi:hypothetical protein
LTLSGGSLELTNALEASSIASFSVVGGVLKGSGEVDVTSSFSGGGNGTLAGTGSTVIESGATGTVNGSTMNLEERALCNTVVVGGTAGISAGVGAEVGTGPSYTEVIQF